MKNKKGVSDETHAGGLGDEHLIGVTIFPKDELETIREHLVEEVGDGHRATKGLSER